MYMYFIFLLFYAYVWGVHITQQVRRWSVNVKLLALSSARVHFRPTQNRRSLMDRLKNLSQVITSMTYTAVQNLLEIDQ